RDGGLHVSVIVIPGRMSDPRQGSYEASAITPLTSAAAKRDIAVTLILTEAPEWLTDAPAPERQLPVLEALAKACGPAVRFYQPMASSSAVAASDVATQWKTVQDKLSATQKTATLVGPPISLDAQSLPSIPATASLPLGFEVSGDTDGSLARLADFAKRSGRKWSSGDWWWQRGQPQRNSGHLYDGIAVLRYFVAAARAGVSNVVWF